MEEAAYIIYSDHVVHRDSSTGIWRTVAEEWNSVLPRSNPVQLAFRAWIEVGVFRIMFQYA